MKHRSDIDIENGERTAEVIIDGVRRITRMGAEGQKEKRGGRTQTEEESVRGRGKPSSTVNSYTYALFFLRRWCFFSDSMTAIISISSITFHSDNTKPFECQPLIYQLKARVDNFIFQWIPSHCRVPGKDAGDCLAKKAVSILQLPLGIVPL
ncbi:hypothetical protein CEXT_811031 [Caerostris extrusa]|uniref:RNase H type-1 domain-containing protein n=1 Tax=Caerostris extrusa TaxID=172846 RepID=A0AAV4Q5U4_CAEEX|nr:hypothetical protein CEXT_811031 [Caerostris extrusa]